MKIRQVQSDRENTSGSDECRLRRVNDLGVADDDVR